MGRVLVPTSGSGWGFSRPQPNPEVEARVRKWLQDIDSLLDLRWYENIHYNHKHGDYEGRYAFVARWPVGDKRYGMIQTGELGDEPYDILGWAAEDIQDGGSAAVDLDSIENKVLALLASADNTRVPWKQRLETMARKNAERRRKIKAEFLENQVHDYASYYRSAGLGITQVNVPKEITTNVSIADEGATNPANPVAERGSLAGSSTE